MKSRSLRSAVLLLSVTVAFALGRAAEPAEAALPSPWKHQDVGAVPLPGTASAADGVFTLRGALDIWGTNDGCHFAWQPLKGDGAIVARVGGSVLDHVKVTKAGK